MIKGSVPTFDVNWLKRSSVFVVKVTNEVITTYLRWKMWRKEEQKNWTVKHNLCYWMSNKPRITGDYFFIQNTMRFQIYRWSRNHNYRYIYNCKHICAYMHLFLPQVLYTGWCLSKLYTDTIFVKKTCKCFQRKERKKKEKWKKQGKKAQIGTSVRARLFIAGLLARSQLASGRSCDRPTRSRFSAVLLGPRTNAELVPKFDVASHAALPMVTPKISP
jgi:hypothetical protein